ncbi:MAG TPA: VCBS repeat-containing protein [Fimbriimonas sp.]
MDARFRFSRSVALAALAACGAIAQPDVVILAKSPETSTKTIYRAVFMDSTAAIYDAVHLQRVPVFTSATIGQLKGAIGIDLALMSEGSLILRRYYGNGELFQEFNLGVPANGLTEVKGIGDFDVDGIPEVVLYDPSTEALGGYEVEADGTATFVPVVNNMPDPVYTRVLAICDLDKDGQTDIVYENPANQNFRYGYTQWGEVTSYSWATCDPDPHPEDPARNFNSRILAFVHVDGDAYADVLTNPAAPRVKRVWTMEGIFPQSRLEVGGLLGGYRKWDFLAANSYRPL